ncbi:MAG: NAD(P)/FAD-dependent oxidoreductase [Streptosporangiales bacterium]|nr:NAD(P)/FAD-dependent oxidoreductase [Streptosporangiales bacterium]
MSESYDVIVIGAGPVGENAADRAVRGGLTAAIVESELVGGECSYWACMPSKALLRPVAAVAEANTLGTAASAALDPRAVLERRDKFTSGWKDDGQVRWLDSARIALYRGHGRISGERRVTVGGEELTARHAVVIATGSVAVVPPPLKDVRPWTSREATSARVTPESLAIVGGGVVGCEMAAAWQALGSRVTLIARGRLLDRLPGFAGDLVADGLRDAGVDVRLGTSVTAASRDERVTLELDDGSRVEAAEVLAATGRAPATGDIGLETAGLEPGSWLDVDDTLRVGGREWLYACGDVNHLALLTHMGKYQARICGDAIAARARGASPATGDEASRTAVPQVIFTVPEVASVGAVSPGPGERTVEFDIGNVAGAALFADGYSGKAQMVVDEERRTMTGVTLAGPGTGEMIHAATIAVAGQVPLEKLWHAVPSYPTISELWLRLLESYGL